MGARDCLIGWPFTHTICFPFGLIALGFAPFGLVSSALSLGHRLIRSHRWMDLVDKLLSYMDLSFPFMRGFDVIVGECRPCPSLVLLELYCAFESRGDLLKCRLWYRRLQGGTHDHAFLTSSQVTPRTRCVETILCFVKTCFKIIQKLLFECDPVFYFHGHLKSQLHYYRCTHLVKKRKILFFFFKALLFRK